MRLLKIVPDNTNLPFVSLRKWAFGLTLLLSIAALALVFTKGLNLGVDFVGGLMIEEKFASPPSLDKLRTTIDNLELGEARLQTVGNDNTISIKLPRPRAATRVPPTASSSRSRSRSRAISPMRASRGRIR